MLFVVAVVAVEYLFVLDEPAVNLLYLDFSLSNILHNWATHNVFKVDTDSQQPIVQIDSSECYGFVLMPSICQIASTQSSSFLICLYTLKTSVYHEIRVHQLRR